MKLKSQHTLSVNEMAHPSNPDYAPPPPSFYTTPTATVFCVAQATTYVGATTQLIVTPCGLWTYRSLYAREQLSSAVYAAYVPCATGVLPVPTPMQVPPTKQVEFAPPTVVADEVSTEEQRVAIAMVDMATHKNTPITTFDPFKGAR